MTEGLVLRPARAADLPACGITWRDGLNGYLERLRLPEVPPEYGPIGRLHGHALTTDPDRFWVATRPAGHGEVGDGEVLAGFGSAVVRGPVWFLSMLFVRPEEQGAGVGRAILDRILPDRADRLSLATATDSLQPISNGLYASLGMVPRLPIWNLTGRPLDGALGPLPDGVAAVSFETLVTGSPGAEGHRDLAAIVNAIDTEVVGFAHPEDHAFLRREGRSGFLYRATGGRAIGYGYASPVGRIGPVAVLEAELLPAILGHLLAAVEPRGASAVWVPGAAGATFSGLLKAGLRLDGHPVLLCWSSPFADFSRYLPISPGLL